MSWVLLLLAVMVPSAIAHHVDSKNENYDFAYHNTPQYRFDSGAKSVHCWPAEAIKKNSGKCNDFDVSAPAYYKITDCQDKYRKLSWWIWFGERKTCNEEAISDWEHININFIKDDTTGKWIQDSVTFYQFDGWFTTKKLKGQVIVYVGKVRHGSYDNLCPEEKCNQPCEYWNDFRDDRPNGKHWFPINIQDVSVIPEEIGKAVHDHKYFSNQQTNSCFGEKNRCTVGSCGCYRNDHTFPAPYCDK